MKDNRLGPQVEVLAISSAPQPDTSPRLLVPIRQCRMENSPTEYVTFFPSNSERNKKSGYEIPFRSGAPSGPRTKIVNPLRGKKFRIYLLFVAKRRLLISEIQGPQSVTEILGI